jgi:hypothetical protein
MHNGTERSNENARSCKSKNENGGFCIIILMMLLRESLLAVVRHPALWRWIDISGNRRRHPADTEAEKDQQEELRVLTAPDCQCEYENNRPYDGEAGAVDPIVSKSIHLTSRSIPNSLVRKESSRTSSHYTYRVNKTMRFQYTSI